jgi:serine/threonine protein kinase
MHRAGWVWRDCKPKNIIITRTGQLVPIDFEGAARINQPDYLGWSTPGFTPPESRTRKTPSGKADDLYGLGAMIYLLLTGRIFEPDQPVAIQTHRRGVPLELRQLTESLLSNTRRKRPSAESASALLNAILLRMSQPQPRLVAGKGA